MKALKRYFEFWRKDTLVITHLWFIFLTGLLFSIIASQSKALETLLTEPYSWLQILIAVIIVMAAVNVITIKIVQAKFMSQPLPGDHYGNIIVLENGHIASIEYTLWIKGKVYAINWVNGNWSNQNLEIELEYNLRADIENTTILVPVTVVLKLSHCCSNTEIFDILSKAQPNKIENGEPLDVDEYLSDVVRKIKNNNKDRIKACFLEYFKGNITEAALLNELANNIDQPEKIFSNIESVNYTFGKLIFKAQKELTYK